MLWLLGITVVLLSWFLWWAWRKKQALIAQFVQSRLLAQLTVGVSQRRQKLRLTLLVGAVAMLLFALARPQYGFVWEEAKQRGLDIVVAIDTSRSMLASDVTPDRLTRAKLAALDLMRLARTDRFGLVAFAGTAFLQCPLTLDDEAFRQSVNALDTSIIPQGGTALAEAIDTAVTAFKEAEDNHRVLVLFTDGEDNEGGVEEAAEKAAKAGLRIFTIGVGTPEGERLRVVNERGQTVPIADEDGHQVVSKLNEKLLRTISQKTGGDYLLLRGARPIELLYEARLAPLPKSDIAARLFQQFYERFQWPLGLAILLLILELFLPDRQRVQRTEAIVNATHEELRKAVALIGLVLFAGTTHASPSKALRDYSAGHYQDAQREYERLLKRRPDDPRLHYNAGTAAFRAGRFDQATNDLNAAILSPDPLLLQRAYYNLGNARFRLGEAAEDVNAKASYWEQSVQDYDSALKLDPRDADAKFNRDVVSSKLEKLKQQQAKSQPKQDQQSPQDKNDKNQKKQDDKKQEQPSQQPKESQDRKPDSSKPDQAKNDQQRQSQPPKPPQPSPNQAQDQAKAGNEKTKSSSAQPSSKDSKSQPNGQPADADGVPMGQMTPEQARQLLEAAKVEEKPLIFVLPPDGKHRARITKDW